MDIEKLTSLWVNTSGEKWTSDIDENGFMVIRIPHEHDIVCYDLEGSCKECFSNVEFIVELYNSFPEILKQLCGS